jgi:hypothetical protein
VYSLDPASNIRQMIGYPRGFSLFAQSLQMKAWMMMMMMMSME